MTGGGVSSYIHVASTRRENINTQSPDTLEEEIRTVIPVPEVLGKETTYTRAVPKVRGQH